MKTNKSYTKRIKVTRNGKLIARKPGQDHFNAKESGRAQTNKRRSQSLTVPNRIRRSFLSSKSK